MEENLTAPQRPHHKAKIVPLGNRKLHCLWNLILFYHHKKHIKPNSFPHMTSKKLRQTAKLRAKTLEKDRFNTPVRPKIIDFQINMSRVISLDTQLPMYRLQILCFIVGTLIFIYNNILISCSGVSVLIISFFFFCSIYDIILCFHPI